MKHSAVLPSLAVTTLAFLLAGCSSIPPKQTETSSKLSAQIRQCGVPGEPDCITPPPPPPPPPSTNRFIEIYLNSLYTTQTTDSQRPEGGIGNTRDEVFVQVAADTPGGQYPMRLPRRSDNDDYYGFSAYSTASASDPSTWLNRDNAYMGRPMIYSGPLADGQSVQFVVTLLEQDNSDLGTIRSALDTALGGLDGLKTGDAPTDAIIQATVATAKGLTQFIPNNNAGDIIGGFTVRVTNKAGVLERTWLPLGKVVVSKGTSETKLDSNSPYALSNSTANLDLHSFGMQATSDGQYQATVAVETVDENRANEDRPLQYLGEQNDACGSDNLVLSGVQIAKNQTRGVNVTLRDGLHFWNSGQYFRWTCDGTEEQTGPDSETNYVIAAHYGGYNDRNIRWFTFKKVSR